VPRLPPSTIVRLQLAYSSISSKLTHVPSEQGSAFNAHDNAQRFFTLNLFTKLKAHNKLRWLRCVEYAHAFSTNPFYLVPLYDPALRVDPRHWERLRRKASHWKRLVPPVAAARPLHEGIRIG